MPNNGPPKILFVFRGGTPNTHTCTHQTPAKVFYGYLGWGCLNCTMPKKIVGVLGWRPKHPYHCTPDAGKGVLWILGMGMFGLHNAKKCCLGSGVALQMHTPLHTIRQQGCVWIPGMMAVELHNNKNYTKNIETRNGRKCGFFCAVLQARIPLSVCAAVSLSIRFIFPPLEVND